MFQHVINDMTGIDSGQLQCRKKTIVKDTGIFFIDNDIIDLQKSKKFYFYRYCYCVQNILLELKE